MRPTRLKRPSPADEADGGRPMRPTRLKRHQQPTRPMRLTLKLRPMEPGQ
jgi:hypothetical protein